MRARRQRNRLSACVGSVLSLRRSSPRRRGGGVKETQPTHLNFHPLLLLEALELGHQALFGAAGARGHGQTSRHGGVVVGGDARNNAARAAGLSASCCQRRTCREAMVWRRTGLGWRRGRRGRAAGRGVARTGLAAGRRQLPCGKRQQEVRRTEDSVGMVKKTGLMWEYTEQAEGAS